MPYASVCSLLWQREQNPLLSLVLRAFADVSKSSDPVSPLTLGGLQVNWTQISGWESREPWGCIPNCNLADMADVRGFPVFPEGSYCLNFRSCKFPSVSWLIMQEGEWSWSVCVSPKCETHVQWIMAAAATCVSWLQLPKPPAVPVLLGSTCRRMERPAHLVKSKLYNTFVHVWNMQPMNNCYLKRPWLCSKFIQGNTSTFRSFL